MVVLSSREDVRKSKASGNRVTKDREFKGKTAKKKETDEPIKASGGATKKPADVERKESETGFQSDIKDTGPAAEEIKKQESKIRGEQRQRGEEAQERLSEQVETLATKQEMWYQENVAEPAREAAQARLIGAEEAKAQGRNLEAGIRMSGYAATQVGIGFVEELTTPLRPRAIQKQIQGAKDIIQDTPQQVKSDQEYGYLEEEKVGTRELVITGIKADPVAFVCQAGGSALAGALVADLGAVAYNKYTGTERVKVTQLDDLTIRDVDVSGRGAPIKTELDPSIKTRYQRVPAGSYDDLLDVKADTLLGTVEGQGFKITLGADDVDDLLRGRKVRVDSAKGEMVPLPDEYKPVFGLETIEPDFKTSGKTRLQRGVKTTGSELYKEMGAGSPFDANIPVKVLESDSPVTMRVTGAAKLGEDTVESIDFTPPRGAKTPWDLADQKRAVSGVQKILREGPPEPPTSGKGFTGLKTRASVETVRSFPLRRVQRASGQQGWWLGGGGAIGETVSEFSRTQLKERGKVDSGMFTGSKARGGLSSKDMVDEVVTPSNIVKDYSINRQGGGLDTKTVPIPDIVPDIIPDIIPDQTPRQTPKQTPAQIIEPTQPKTQPPPPPIPSIIRSPRTAYLPQEQTRRKRVKRGNQLIGYELKSYDLLKPESFRNKKGFKI